ncbi:MAG: hypothetical protein BGP23_11855 [Lysobacterales bacterium 66-474]|nr:MAG: hypothetical protein ABT18_03720 [Rhodanobacter sp. SCN 66-43]OJY87100.1 MAG: hypothetical protein BGP23_11855 [Xanthomonadales bacterium 66-474]
MRCSLIIKLFDSQMKPKTELIAAIGEATRLFQDSTDAFDDAACAALGINRTDLKCLGMIVEANSISAGELAAGMGLTRGAMTTALDRIERAGYARRVADPDDRRGIRVELTPSCMRSLEAIWGGIRREGEAMMSGYTAAELATVLRFIQEARALQQRDTQRVRKLKLGNT